MKLLNNIFLTIILTSFAFTQQGKNLALDYERALRLTNANEALKIYESIINTNEDSDYVWLSKLKKAEMLYAKGSYITSSNLLKEFNLNAPLHLQNQSSKVFYLNLLMLLVRQILLKCIKNYYLHKKPKKINQDHLLKKYGLFNLVHFQRLRMLKY